MRLVCPSCGAIHSFEAWANDPEVRRFVADFMRLPSVVQPRVGAYLSCFRKGDKGLRWPIARKVLAGLLDLVGSGRVSWERSELRPAPPELWAEALDAVIARDKRGFTNHNYLRHTAFEMAGSLAAQEERQAEATKQHRDYIGPALKDEKAVSEEERAEVARALREFTERFGG